MYKTYRNASIMIEVGWKLYQLSSIIFLLPAPDRRRSPTPSSPQHKGVSCKIKPAGASAMTCMLRLFHSPVKTKSQDSQLLNPYITLTLSYEWNSKVSSVSLYQVDNYWWLMIFVLLGTETSVKRFCVPGCDRPR